MRPSTWFLAGVGGLTGFFVLEATTRERGRASSLDAGAEDEGTTRGIVLAYAVAGTLATTLALSGGPRLPAIAGPTGLALQAAGLGLRAWSMRTLGRHYSRTLQAEEAQPVVESGPYALVRHPGYAGSILIWLGFGLTTGSPAAVVIAATSLGIAYRRRIVAEERLLERELPGYAAYRGRTARLIPGIW